jgi:hypothetical protein
MHCDEAQRWIESIAKIRATLKVGYFVDAQAGALDRRRTLDEERSDQFGFSREPVL